MSLIKQSASKKSLKHPRIASENFRSIDADMAYNNYYKKASIILERTVTLETHDKIVREFFANTIVEGDRIGCWLWGREFYDTKEFIQEILEVCPPTQQSYIHYDDRLDSLVPIMEILDGDLKKKALNTIPFTLEMWTLAYIMLYNLYLMKNLTTLSRPKAIFLLDLFSHKEINICNHI